MRDAAKQNLDTAKQEYLDAVKLAKTKGRPKATITKDPSFAKQDPKDLLPRRYNPILEKWILFKNRSKSKVSANYLLIQN